MDKNYAFYLENGLLHSYEYELGASDLSLLFDNVNEHKISYICFLSFGKKVFYQFDHSIELNTLYSWLSKFNRKLLQKDRSYKVGDYLSLKIDEDSKDLVFTLFYKKLDNDDRIFYYDLILDQAECGVIADNIQFIIRHEREQGRKLVFNS